MLPTYPPYGKRILMDNGWYEAITRDDVELITHKLERVTADAVVTSDGERHPFGAAHCGERWKTSRRSGVPAISGTTCMALAPVPRTATRLPTRSMSCRH